MIDCHTFCLQRRRRRCAIFRIRLNLNWVSGSNTGGANEIGRAVNIYPGPNSCVTKKLDFHQNKILKTKFKKLQKKFRKHVRRMLVFTQQLPW